MTIIVAEVSVTTSHITDCISELKRKERSLRIKKLKYTGINLSIRRCFLAVSFVFAIHPYESYDGYN